ncbi:hypothetical protein [Nitrosospira sp. Is2]|uniref:hypothetical protein n=1 Tax=Nitrosospira sp. Is2 TaxID=3080532 RepID=UPI002953C461|nr:hypothetical protein [Nitrosospira sp. Is2]WON74782.1 hypothetical protein R5L00_04655 [Nitrosospira sp. Is2]
MEELLATIQSQPIRDYMREAMNCYMASAYRGCIVLSYIALFDDLLSKLGELSKINAPAKTIFDTARQKREDQDVYEAFLIDQLGSKNLLTGLDTSFLNTLRTLRNKSAHPSGHQPSAEEARFIFRETVSRFLSRPILSTTQLVDEIVIRLNNSNFFPSVINAEIKGVVGEEISTLHEKALPVLVTKLAASVTASDPTVVENSTAFLIGLALLDNDDINTELQKKILAAKSDDLRFSSCILQLLSANGKLFLGLQPVPARRISGAISKQIDEVKNTVPETRLSHPAMTIISIAKHLDDASLLNHFKFELEKLFQKKPYSPYLIDTLTNRPDVVALYYPIILANAGSANFHTANIFSSSVERIESQLAALCSDEQAFQLFVAVLEAANYGAYESKALRDSNFAGVPKLKTKVVAYLLANEHAAIAYLGVKLGVIETSTSFVSTYLSDDGPASE